MHVASNFSWKPLSFRPSVEACFYGTNTSESAEVLSWKLSNPWKLPWKHLRARFRGSGSFRGSDVRGAFHYFHESFRDFFSMEASISSMEAFTDISMEASGIFFHGIFQIFHGSFHELPRKKQVVQDAGFVCVSLGYSSNPG